MTKKQSGDVNGETLARDNFSKQVKGLMEYSHRQTHVDLLLGIAEGFAGGGSKERRPLPRISLRCRLVIRNPASMACSSKAKSLPPL